MSSDAEMKTTEAPAKESTSNQPSPTPPTASTTAPIAAATATATPAETAKAPAAVVNKKETKVARDGCNCQGSCLQVCKRCFDYWLPTFSSYCHGAHITFCFLFFLFQHTCACFVEGHFCDPSSCKCCAPPSNVGLRPQANTCQNNDKQTNVERRKAALLAAMRNHPDSFWGPKLLSSKSSKSSSKSKTTSVTTVNATEPQPPLDSKILILIQDLVNDRLVGSGDAMDIDTSDSPTIADLNRLFVMQELHLVPGEHPHLVLQLLYPRLVRHLSGLVLL